MIVTNFLVEPVATGQAVIVLNQEWILDWIKENIFTVRAMKHWHRWPREVVATPFLETFKVSLAGALSNLI